MTRLRLFIGLGLLVVGGLLVFASSYLGGRVQTEYAAVFSENATWVTRARLQCERLGYDRGVFSSNATTRISLRDEDAPAVILRHRIRHGPFLTGGDRLLGLARVRTVAELEHGNGTGPFRTAFQNKIPLRATTRVALDRSLRSRITSPPDNWQSRDREFVWGGLNATVSLLRGSKKGMELAFRLPRVEVDVPGRTGDLLLSGVRFSSSRQKNQRGRIVNSTAELRCSRFRAWGGVRAESIALRSRTDRAGEGFLWSESELSFQQGRCGKTDIPQGSFRVRLENLDTEALYQWRSELTRNRNDLSRERLRELVQRFLSGSPHLEEAKLRLRTEEGEIRWDTSAAFDGSGELAIGDSRKMLQRVRVESRFSVPSSIGIKLASLPVRFVDQLSPKKDSGPQDEAVPSRAREWLKKLREMGYISRDSGRYSLSLKLEKGMLRVSGKPVLPLGIFLQDK
jgi:uncharacterized protein YdgA (DUF945 family)